MLLRSASAACVLAAAVSIGCGPPTAVGTTTLVRSGVLLAPEAARPDRVSLVFGELARPAREVATVTASASTLDFGSVAAAEGAALERLRFQAALAGADAVGSIERQVFDTGAWITYDDDFFGGPFYNDRRGRLDPYEGPVFRSGTARERRDLEVNFRGTAVRWVEGVR